MTTAERKAMLETALDRVITQIAEGPIKPSYSKDGQSFSWAEWRKMLEEEALSLQSLIESLGDDEGGIVEVVTQYTTGGLC